MKLYSDYAGHRTRQIVYDVLAILAIIAWAVLGYLIYTLVMNLAEFGVQMEESGAGFKDTMVEISANIDDVPFIGDGISAPFDAASDAGARLEEAGQAQQVAVEQLATGLGVGIAILPILTILVFWLVPRIRFARRAGRTTALLKQGSSLDLFALRALGNQKLSALAAIDGDPAGAWRRNDENVIRALASLELRSAGVRLGDGA